MHSCCRFATLMSGMVIFNAGDVMLGILVRMGFGLCRDTSIVARIVFGAVCSNGTILGG